ncbi:MAG: DinB family protein [Nocardioidaceae bacterium]
MTDVTARQDPPFVAGERAMLDAWLDYHRATLLLKCAGLDDTQIRTRSVPPSTLSLLGLVRHMREVEQHWFLNVLHGLDEPPAYYSDTNPDGEFDDVDSADVAADLAAYQAVLDRCRAAVADLDLDTICANPGRADRISLRWVYTHMVEEYARHNGHADLLRECVDGVTGE